MRPRVYMLFDLLSQERHPEISTETVLPARAGRTAPLPPELHPVLVDSLGMQGVSSLWVHQRAAWDVAQRGEHLIVTTGTASGKSMCFNLPVLHDLLGNRSGRALYLYPTKALTADQVRRIRPLGGGEVEVAVYDGDTPADARRQARERARILLTNPDMISMGMLPHHDRWGDFFYNLRWVVIDEAHVYRGVFGSHVANVLRRLRRVAELYGSEPQFILASATIGNAPAHAATLTGLEVEPVQDDGAPLGRRKLVLWNPPIVDEALNLRKSNSGEAAEILAELIGNEVRTICFTRSRKGAELLFQYTKEKLEEKFPRQAGRLSPYRAGYTPEQRRKIEEQLMSGELLAVVSTNALEVGIDIGKLDAVLTVGYPGTVASLWQQWGRAGRGKGESLGIFVAGNDALEQFFMRRPRELLERDVEAATTDFANPYIFGRHLVAAAYEAPLVPDDAAFFGPDMEKTADRLARDGAGLTRSGNSWLVTGDGYPAGDINLRSSSADQFAIVDGETGDIIGTQEAESAFSTVHPQAVYLHRGESYLVTDLDLEGRVVLVRRFYDAYYTQPKSESTTEILREEDRLQLGPITLHFGNIAVSRQVIAFQKKRLGSDEVLGTEELDLPAQHFVTESLWFTVPLDLLEEAELPRLPGALHAIEHGMISLLPLLAMCDRTDIGGLSTPLHPQTGMPTIFVHDGHPGGVGIARRGYAGFLRWLRDTIALIDNCPCEAGCPSCIQSPKCGNWNDPLDKELSVELLRRALAAVTAADAVGAARPRRADAEPDPVAVAGSDADSVINTEMTA